MFLIHKYPLVYPVLSLDRTTYSRLWNFDISFDHRIDFLRSFILLLPIFFSQFLRSCWAYSLFLLISCFKNFVCCLVCCLDSRYAAVVRYPYCLVHLLSDSLVFGFCVVRLPSVEIMVLSKSVLKSVGFFFFFFC
jgi:hypothetical protein